MKPTTLFAALLGVLVGAGGAIYYAKNVSSPATDKPVSSASTTLAAQALTLGQSVSGELTSKSFLNLSDGVRSSLFDVKAEAGQIIKISVSGPLRPQISVLRNGELVTRSQRCEDCPDSETKGQTTTLGFKADFNDTYQVVVSGFNTSSYGPFQVTVDTLKAYTGEPLSADQTIHDWALGGQKRYRLTIDKDGLYSLAMKAEQSSLDAYLKLMDRRGMELASDDDSAGGTDARLQMYLKAGDYIVQASSAMGSQNFQGGFSLEIKPEEMTGEIELKNGDSLSLDGEGKTGLFTGETQTYSFTLSEPKLVTVQMDAQGFQASLEVDSSTASQYGDEAGQQRVRGVLAAGEHQVKISGSSQAGLFTLSATADEVPANAGGGVLLVGEPRQALMLQGITSDSYQLNVRQAGRYVIDMTSPIFDTYLVLRKDGQTVAEDDDSGGDMNARLEVQLEVGEYEVKAMSLGSYEQDMEYELSVQRL
ncbi:hypothetical protein [Alcaligenes sp. CHO6]|jgi:hypothetical protein|uniref:hypothetical protein n=1 Tax=unclassified Alcaligenes TaxID=259357 RepID=UPI000750686F|nr:hypothetical protein QEZ63_07880 [Alcaligenes faecalis]HRK87210.1 hypothetical protein [Alcaligenes faecalis]